MPFHERAVSARVEIWQARLTFDGATRRETTNSTAAASLLIRRAFEEYFAII